MKKPLIALGITVILLIACAQTTPTIQPTNTATATPIAPTLTPLPTISPTPTPIVPTWSPYQPDDATGWCWQEVVGHVKYLNDVSFWDARTGWAVGEREAILHTDDGGATWQWQNGPVTATLRHVDFVGPQTGWILGVDRQRWSSYTVLLKTDDGGATWIEQPVPSSGGFAYYPTNMTWPDARTGWLTIEDQIFHTSDGGQTWQEHELPTQVGYAEWDPLVSVDSQHAWAVKDYSDTMIRTDDGGTTWEMQDTRIETPELAYVAAARLTAYASQRDAPWEGLLPLLFPGPCKFQDYGWLLNALHNLGWIEDTRWEAPLLPTDAGYLDMSDIFQHMDVDVDADGEDELVILGSSDIEMVAAVLDWDGTQWQVAWELRPFTRYDSDIRARVDDFDADGHLELLVETLRHLGTGTGVLTQQWDVYLVRCTHLDCQIVWTDDIEYIGRAFSGLYLSYYWRGSDYRFTKPDGVTPGIVVQTYGVDFRQTPITTDTVTSTLTVLTSTQSIYLWDGAVYTPTGSTILTPAYTLDMDPITTTLTDGAYAVQGWEANPDDLWQTLSIYDGDASAPTQVFIAAFTGTPGAGVWLQDIDGDGQFEVKDCDTGFDLDVTLQFTERTSVLPECTIYQWNPSARKFSP